MKRFSERWVGVGGLLVFVGATALLGGCSDHTEIDMRDVEHTVPDKLRYVENADGFPDVTALCINGVGFATTSEDDTMYRVEAWDSTVQGWCFGSQRSDVSSDSTPNNGVNDPSGVVNEEQNSPGDGAMVQ